MKAFHHLTLLTGHVRVSPRAEVEQGIIQRIRGSLRKGSGALWDTGWAVLSLPTIPGAYVFDLSLGGNEVARCYLATTEGVADTLWPDIEYRHLSSNRDLPAKRPPAPWLAVELLPDGIPLLAKEPGKLGELGDLERCVAWALLPDA